MVNVKKHSLRSSYKTDLWLKFNASTRSDLRTSRFNISFEGSRSDSKLSKMAQIPDFGFWFPVKAKVGNMVRVNLNVKAGSKV